MQPLVLYFNELSAPPTDITLEELQNWSRLALSLLSCLEEVNKSRPECTFAFPLGHWHAIYGGKPLSVWLKKWLKEDKYRYLQIRIKNIEQRNDLLYQVYFEAQQTIGLSFAHTAKSWAFSFPKEDSPWLAHFVSAVEFFQDGTDINNKECEIPHLANEQHALHWQQLLFDWGRSTANCSKIGTVATYSIVMYPLDHGYPHIHLIDPQSYKTLAKFRIDQFERMEGPPAWDEEVRVWVNRYRDELIQSWTRCQHGNHPYQIR
jgi:hypothetical protein